MRILLIIDNANAKSGGVEVFFELARQFLSLGHDVSLVSLQGSEWIPYGRTRVATTALQFLEASSFLSGIWKLRSFIDRNPPFDVHHAIGTDSSTTLALAILLTRRSKRAVTLGSEHLWDSALYGDFPHLRGRIMTGVSRFAYRRLDAVICVSDTLRERLLATSGLEECVVYTLRNPVRLLRVPSVSIAKRPRNASVPIQILAAGGLGPRKDFGTLLLAVREVKLTRPCHLTIAGDGGLRDQLASEIDDLGLSEVVSLIGYQPDMGPLYANADVFVLSSLKEGYPLVLIEAMAMGLPLVATDCPCGPAEILDHGRLGELVPTGNPSEMAKAILRVVDDPPDEGLLKDAAQEHKPEQVAIGYLEVFSTVRAHRRPVG